MKGNKNPRRYLPVILLAFLIIRFGFLIWQNRNNFVANYREGFRGLESLYNHSQYRQKIRPQIITDELVYAYAAGEYLNGTSPILIQSEQPPLGKYLIGLSILLFNNPNIIVAGFFPVFLYGCYILSLYLGLPRVFGLFAILAISYETLITDQLRYVPQLDIFLLTYHVWAINCVISAIEKKSGFRYITAAALLGLAMMTKIFTVTIPLYIILSVIWVVYNPKRIKYVFMGMIPVLIICFVSYYRIYHDGMSFIDVFRIQKWIFLYHQDKISRFFTVWPLVYLNRWYVWWGDIPVIQDKSWSFTWPLTLTGLLAYLALTIRKIVRNNSKPAHIIITVWSLIYLTVLSLSQASARYLIPIIPYAYILSVLIIYTGYNRWRKNSI